MGNEKKGVIAILLGLAFIIGVAYIVQGEHTVGTIPAETNVTVNGTVGELSTTDVPEKVTANFTF